MKKIIFIIFWIGTSSLALAKPPSESLVLSCLRQEAASSAIVIQEISPHKFFIEDNYVKGFSAPYVFQYKNMDIGYAEKNNSQALIYMGKLYLLSNAIPLGNNHGIDPSPFTPSLALWNIAKNSKGKYLCVNFNFDGLGQSGSFQNIHGGYFLNLKTKKLYFSVRDIRH